MDNAQKVPEGYDVRKLSDNKWYVFVLQSERYLLNGFRTRKGAMKYYFTNHG